APSGAVPGRAPGPVASGREAAPPAQADPPTAAEPAETSPAPASRPATPEPAAAPTPAAPATAETSGQEASGAVLSLADVRRIWPDLLEAVKKMRRFTWILLSQNAQVIGVDATSLTVGFKTAGARDSFVGGGSEEILRQAAIDMIGADWKIEVAVDPSADPGSETSPRVIRAAVAQPPMPTEPPTDSDGATGSRQASGPPSWATDEGDDAPPSRPRGRPASAATARSNITATRRADEAVPAPGGPDLDADAHRDDLVAEDNALDSTQLLERELGATVIEEISHD
ncbi:MAG: hypothetical protein ABIR34_10980, partial [Marmoricola sp.]